MKKYIKYMVITPVILIIFYLFLFYAIYKGLKSQVLEVIPYLVLIYQAIDATIPILEKDKNIKINNLLLINSITPIVSIICFIIFNIIVNINLYYYIPIYLFIFYINMFIRYNLLTKYKNYDIIDLIIELIIDIIYIIGIKFIDLSIMLFILVIAYIIIAIIIYKRKHNW